MDLKKLNHLPRYQIKFDERKDSAIDPEEFYHRKPVEIAELTIRNSKSIKYILGIISLKCASENLEMLCYSDTINKKTGFPEMLKDDNGLPPTYQRCHFEILKTIEDYVVLKR